MRTINLLSHHCPWFSPKLRHLSKFHKINVASTCEAFNEPDINAEYIETLKQRADVLTKSFGVST